MPFPLSFADAVLTPLARIVDRVIPDPAAREDVKLELYRLEGTHELEAIRTQLSALLAEAQSMDPWTSRARPTFLYVMYTMILWALPMGLISAVSPATARAVVAGMSSYLNGLPEPLYALFGTGYLGYATLRQWGKAKGTDR